jgi:hypothetical protein
MTRSPALLASLALACAGLFGCRGKLLATASLSGPGTAEARFTPGKNMRLWADYDGEWTGGGGSKHSKPPLKYDIDVLQGGKSLGRITCTTPSNGGTKVCSGETSIGNDHTGNCEVSLDCNLPALGSGEVTLKVTGSFSDPARIKKVTKMSLNVRED